VSSKQNADWRSGVRRLGSRRRGHRCAGGGSSTATPTRWHPRC